MPPPPPLATPACTGCCSWPSWTSGCRCGPPYMHSCRSTCRSPRSSNSKPATLRAPQWRGSTSQPHRNTGSGCPEHCTLSSRSPARSRRSHGLYSRMGLLRSLSTQPVASHTAAPTKGLYTWPCMPWRGPSELRTPTHRHDVPLPWTCSGAPIPASTYGNRHRVPQLAPTDGTYLDATPPLRYLPQQKLRDHYQLTGPAAVAPGADANPS